MNEVVEYAQHCVLLRAVARVLSLSPTVTCTALVLLHQARNQPEPWTLTPQDLVGASLWVACKAEEVNCSSNQLINTVALLSSGVGHHLTPLLAAALSQQPAAAAAGQTHAPASTNPATGAVVALGPNPSNSSPQDKVPAAAAAAVRHQRTAAPKGGSNNTGSSRLQPGRGTALSAAVAAAAEGPGPPRRPPPAGRTQQAPAPAAAAAAALAAHHPPNDVVTLSTAVLTGPAYYAAKSQMFVAEQHLLRCLRFQLLTPQPHAHLLNLVKLVKPGAAVATAAVCLLNDALVFTRLIVQHPPEVLAVGCLQAASQVAQGAAADINHVGDSRTANAAQQQQEQEQHTLDPEGGPALTSTSELGSRPSNSTLHEDQRGETTRAGDRVGATPLPWVLLLDVPHQQVAAVTVRLLQLWRWLQGADGAAQYCLVVAGRQAG